jgi:hypothetical protein
MAAGGGRIGFAEGTQKDFDKFLNERKEAIREEDLDRLMDQYKQWYRQNYPQFEEAAGGGRIGFGLGGIDKARRAFLKMMAGITAGGVAAGTGLLKLGKAAKVVPKVAETVVTIEKTAGMPIWFPKLVNKVINEGDDVTKKLATIERETVHTKKIGAQGTYAGDEVTVYRNLDSGDVRVEYGGPLFNK